MFKAKNQLVKKKKIVNFFKEIGMDLIRKRVKWFFLVFFAQYDSLIAGRMQERGYTEEVSQHSKYTEMWVLSVYFTFCILGVITLFLQW